MAFLKLKENPKKINKFIIAGILFLMAITYYLSTPLVCKIHASSIQDYCFKFSLNINNSGNAQSFKPVLLPNVNMDNWIDEEYIDEFAWSIYPYKGSLTNEYDVLLQDINNVSSSQWYTLPILSTGDNLINVLLGANNIQRNQGILFAGEDYLNILNHNDFNQNNFSIYIEFQELLNVGGSENAYTLFEKYDELNDSGFALQLIHNCGFTGQNCLRGFVGDGSNTMVQSSVYTPDNLNKNVLFEYDNNTNIVSISLNGAAPQTSSGANLSSNTEDLKIGVNWNNSFITPDFEDYLSTVVIRVFKFQNTIGTFGTRAMYGFNPQDITQTSVSNPEYAGNVIDISNSLTDHILSYYFNRDQTDYIVTASPIVVSSSSGSSIFSSLMKDVLGRWYGSGNPSDMIDGNENFFMLSFLTPSDDLVLPDNLWYSMWLSAFGLIMAIAVYWLFASVPISLFTASIPLVIGGIQGLLAPEFLIIWFLLFMGLYSTSQWYERT